MPDELRHEGGGGGPSSGGLPPLISVIVPAYNTAPYIAEALDSVFQQSFDGTFEVIVVNDGSPDTEALERALIPYRHRIRYVMQDNRGLSGARNAALRLARGQYVAILDSDDRLHPEYLASQLAVLQADSTVDVVFADAERFGPGISPIRFSNLYPMRGRIDFSSVLSRRCQIHGEVLARTRAFTTLGGYDEKLRSAEDLDLWLRLLHSGGRIVFNDRPLTYYRARAGSLTADHRSMAENLLRVLDKVEAFAGISAADRREIVEQRTALTSDLRLMDAKQALVAGDTATALRLLKRINGQRRSAKIVAVSIALRVAPSWTLRLLRQVNRA